MSSSAGSGSGGMTSTGAGTKVGVTLKLSQLQNLVKRDPVGYREDYDVQIRRLQSEIKILKLSTSSSSGAVAEGGGGGVAAGTTSSATNTIVELIQFSAATSSSSYKGRESDRIANMLVGLLVGGSTDDDDEDGNDGSFERIDTVSKDAKSNKPNNPTSFQMTIPSAALQLHRDVRKACVSALILMRNKGALKPLHLLELFFRLMAVVPDKGLRELLYRHMVHDIRNINKKGKRDDKVNRSIQTYLHKVVTIHGQSDGTGSGNESATDVAAKRGTDLVCELYRRQVWNDERAVAILASACVSQNTTVMSRAMRFFLNIEDKMAEDQKQEEEEVWDASQKIDFHRFSRKTKKRGRHVERQVSNRQREQRKREGTTTDEWMDVRDDQGVEEARKLYPAMELLRDPQGLAESVLKRLKHSKSSIPYRIKLLMMNFVTRLVGNHELMLLQIYPYLQKYMGGQQRDVTAILAYTVQACHEQVPPDEIYGILKTIAHNFVTERCSEEQMAVGINAVRAICARTPAVLTTDADFVADGGTGTSYLDVEAFVRDIAGYSNHRDRSVSIAGKAFMNFIRETHPTLLQGKDRGLKGSALHRAKAKPMRFGEQKVSYGVEGADLLVEYESKKAAYLKKKHQEGTSKDGDDDDDSEGEFEEEFNDIEGEEDEEELELSDDEAPDLVALDPNQSPSATAKSEDSNGVNDVENQHEDVIDLSKMTPEERNNLKQEISSTRVFTPSDFAKMRKLVQREERARRDPREAARRKRAAARGEDFEELSEDSDDDASDDEVIRIAGAVAPGDIMADARRKRQSKAEKLEKVLAGRESFETKQRAGGSTNTEKERKKNFLMTKSSKSARSKGRGKGGLAAKRGHGGKKQQMGHEAKKRRRKS
mmetsp:Transcript_6014/g.14909  ORF Transcript_6014/g.14909 Transcript_6014/m.14909 type:complete len:882 (+) Transcript_6014:90-2735(+)